ncbi:flagellar export chaperone FlgN [bacterium]|nr:flagellar export chaperone FlgN [bacterium]
MKNDPTALRELDGLLQEEIRCYGRLLLAMDRHLIALRNQDAVEIGEAMQANLECVEFGRQAGLRRLKLAGRLLLEAGLRPDSGMEELLKIYADDLTQPLREKLDGISRLGRDIRIINDRNRALAEHGLDLLRGDFRILADLVGETADRPGEDGASGKLLSMRA